MLEKLGSSCPFRIKHTDPLLVFRYRFKSKILKCRTNLDTTLQDLITYLRVPFCICRWKLESPGVGAYRRRARHVTFRLFQLHSSGTNVILRNDSD